MGLFEETAGGKEQFLVDREVPLVNAFANMYGDQLCT